MNIKPIDQNKIISLLRNQSAEGLGIIYDQFAPVLYGMAVRMVKDEKIAEVVLKETIQYIWNNHSDFDDSKQSIGIWMVTILRKISQGKVSFQSYLQNQDSLYYVNMVGQNNKAKNNNELSITKTGVSSGAMEQENVLNLILYGGGSIADVADHLAIDDVKAKQLLRETLNQFRKESPQTTWK